MTVAIGPILWLMASLLLGAVLLLAVFGFILWLTGRKQPRSESEGHIWEHNPTDIAGPDGTSIAASGK